MSRDAEEADRIAKDIKRMRRQLAVWLLETVAMMLSLVLLSSAWDLFESPPKFPTLRSLIAGLWIIGLLFIFSGYVLSTALFGTLWRSRSLWTYPIIAGALFILHAEFFVSARHTPTTVLVEIAGSFLAIAFAYTSNRYLQERERRRMVTQSRSS